MIRLALALYLLASLCCAYRSWGELSWEAEWQVLRTVTPAPSPTPRQDCRVTPNRMFRGMCRDAP